MGSAYDRWVMAPGELPVEQQLEKMGLALVQKPREVGDLGLAASPDSASGLLKVSTVGGPSEGLVEPGDLIVSVGGQRPSAQGRGRQSLRAIQDGLAPGQTVQVVVQRSGLERTIELAVGTRTVSEMAVVDREGTTPEVKALREGWYRAGKTPLAP
jgi:predicted metalloprotease with PDZ domain